MPERMLARIDDHLRVVEVLRNQVPLLNEIGNTIVSSIRGGGTVYVFGNGGSAADAQHIAAELLGRFRLERRALPAVALTANSSILTAVGIWELSSSSPARWRGWSGRATWSGC